MENKQTGITLIALVVTIIILLILAGITIAQLTENRLFEKVKKAKENYIKSQENENSILGNYENKIYSVLNNDVDGYKQEKLLEILGEEGLSGEISIWDNEEIIKKICNNEQVKQYIIVYIDEIYQEIISSEIAIKNMFKDEKIMDTILQDTNKIEKILSSNVAIEALDESNPITIERLTDNYIIDENGNQIQVAYATGNYSGDVLYEAWRAFDGSNSNYKTCWLTFSSNDENYSIIYNFRKKVWLYRGIIENRNPEAEDIVAIKKFKIQGSNDFINWVDLTTEKENNKILGGEGINFTVDIPVAEKFQYIKINVIDPVPNNGVSIGEIQFYAK